MKVERTGVYIGKNSEGDHLIQTAEGKTAHVPREKGKAAGFSGYRDADPKIEFGSKVRLTIEVDA